MPFQNTYDQYPGVGLAGNPVDMRPELCETGAAEVAIAFGLAVVAGADPDVQVKLPTAAGQVLRGIARRTYADVVRPALTGDALYSIGDAVNVVRRGEFWVPVIGAVARDGAAFFINSGANAGKFSATDDATTDPVPTGVFRSSTTGDGLAKLELNLP